MLARGCWGAAPPACGAALAAAAPDVPRCPARTRYPVAPAAHARASTAVSAGARRHAEVGERARGRPRRARRGPCFNADLPAPAVRVRHRCRSTASRRSSAAGTTVNDVIVALCAERGARLAVGARRAARRAARRDGPGLGAHATRRRGEFGNRDLDDGRPDPHRRAGPARRLHRAHEVLRGAKERHGRAAGLAADRRDQLHPASAGARAARTTVDVLRAARARRSTS